MAYALPRSTKDAVVRDAELGDLWVRTPRSIPRAPSKRFRLSLMRPGTFIYHSHLDDVHQLTGGLNGALVVLPPGERFDPATDHVKIVGWNTPGAGSLEEGGDPH